MKQHRTEIKKINESEYLMITTEQNDNILEFVVDAFLDVVILLACKMFIKK